MASNKFALVVFLTAGMMILMEIGEARHRVLDDVDEPVLLHPDKPCHEKCYQKCMASKGSKIACNAQCSSLCKKTKCFFCTWSKHTAPIDPYA
ncbi:hypothetical protein L484_022097 [Morus notabilis]|uniref:Uncharacterized protein n=1 Tax=Morus notabilis TaxID=981085 RepID=W9QYW9_9ROSA|nr:hypothetical protein L484_022097 [Morus notabilis]